MKQIKVDKKNTGSPDVSLINPVPLKKGSDYSTSEIDFIKSGYQKMSCREIALQLGRTREGVKAKALELGVRKTPEALSLLFSRENAGQFKQGAAPINT